MTQLLKVRATRKEVEAMRQESVEAGQVATVQYGDTEILTAHGLRLLFFDLLKGPGRGAEAMEDALDLLMANADKRGWPSVLETPPELFENTDCAGLIVRPSFYNEKLCTWFVEHEGAALIHHFGQRAVFGFLPELFETDDARFHPGGEVLLDSGCPGSGQVPAEIRDPHRNLYGRGLCPVCYKSVALKEDGRLNAHGFNSKSGADRKPGSGRRKRRA